MSEGYTKQVRYTFEAGGENWVVTHWGCDWLIAEETRKNGQEDCHVTFEAALQNGRWKIENEGGMNMYLGVEPYKIEDFLNENGFPE